MARIVDSDFIVNDERPDIVADAGVKKGQKRQSFQRQSNRYPRGSKQPRKDSSVLDEPIPSVSHEFLGRIEDLDTYYLGLLQHKTVVPVSETYDAFMVQGFNYKKSTLKDEYEVVTRRNIKFADGWFWMYSCSCNPARKQLVENMASTIADCFTDLEHPYEQCGHINVLKKLVSDFDEENDISPDSALEREESQVNFDHCYDKSSPKISLYGLQSDETVVCVRWEEGDDVEYAVIRLSYTGGDKNPFFKCMSCKHVPKCKHVTAVLEDSEHEISETFRNKLKSSVKWRSRYTPTSVSKKQIPFHCTEKVIVEEKSLEPSLDGECDCCGCMWGVVLEEEDDVKVYTRDAIISTKVYRRKCSNEQCSNLKDYDGCDDQLLNMGTYLISHDVLRSYMRQFVTEGTTMISFYKEWYWEQTVDNGNTQFADQFSYDRFRYSWYAFLNLVDVNYTSGFSCPECGDCPETVVMDGVSLGIRKCLMPWRNYISSKSSSTVLDGSSHNTRIFINNKRARTLVNKYVKTGLDEGESKEMLTLIKLYQPCLHSFLNKLIEDGEIKCPDLYKDFLYCLSSTYPVCGFIHYHEGLFDCLLACADNTNTCQSVEIIKLIEAQAPILSSLLRKLDWKIPEYLKGVIKEIIVKVKAPYIQGTAHSIPVCPESCYCSGSGFFPTLAKQCHRGDYVLDDKRKEKKSSIPECSKKSPRHPTLTPGLFTVSCIHGICYGFQVMEDMESPNIPYTILRTRFHTAPKLVIYGNACNLHVYCLNRDPVFFRDTWFVVDRFHWCNHTGCHLGYNLGRYLQYRAVNTQVAEQRNATLKKLKSMLSYMNLDNFIVHLKLFLWFRSMISLSVLDPNLPVKNMSVFRTLSKIYSVKR